MKEILLVVALIVFIVGIIIFFPLATIWALNTLFPLLAIPYSVYTWLATAILQIVVVGKGYKS